MKSSKMMSVTAMIFLVFLATAPLVQAGFFGDIFNQVFGKEKKYPHANLNGKVINGQQQNIPLQKTAYLIQSDEIIVKKRIQSDMAQSGEIIVKKIENKKIPEPAYAGIDYNQQSQTQQSQTLEQNKNNSPSIKDSPNNLNLTNLEHDFPEIKMDKEDIMNKCNSNKLCVSLLYSYNKISLETDTRQITAIIEKGRIKELRNGVEPDADFVVKTTDKKILNIYQKAFEGKAVEALWEAKNLLPVSVYWNAVGVVL